MGDVRRSESHLGQQKQPAAPAAYLKNPPIQAVMEVGIPS